MNTELYAPFIRSIIRTFGDIYPLYSGCGTIAQTLFLKSIAPKKPVLVHLKNEKQLWVNPTEHVGRSVYYFGDLDPKITFICRRLLEKGDIFIDIGANIGLVSLLCTDILQNEGEIYAFEPNPEVFQLLKKTVETNKINNMFIQMVGLSDYDGTAEMHIFPENLGSASLSRGGSTQKITVAIKDSLNVFSEILENKDAPYLLKIDVEGHEAVILNRIKPILASKRPKAIVFEFNESQDSQDLSIFNTLRQVGMVIYSIPRTLGKPCLKPLPENFEVRPANDYLAVDEARIDWLKKRFQIQS